MPWLQCRHTIDGSVTPYVLRKALTTVGRSSGNDLVLNDSMVDATHATVVRQGGGHTISLAGRAKEMYVNGQRTKQAKLAEGDVVLIGAYEITFGEGAPEPVAEGSGDDVPLGMLEHLVSLSADLMRDTTPERLFKTLLQGLVELTRAEKGFIIVFRDGQRQLAASHNVDDQRTDLSAVSDSIVDQVVKHLQPLIISDAMNDSRFGRAKSVVDLRLSSVMCVPLIYRNDLLGVIYLGNDKITDLFTERDLSTLKVYSSQAAIIVQHALTMNQLRVDNRNLRDRLRAATHGQIIGTCPPMKKVFKIIKKVAPTDLSVLVLGETGTGKELVAREIHESSERSAGPFIAINCGAIPENLLESELFGHRKGAFTGAVADKVGKVEAAGGGTLFLDEIGEMPMKLQVKLLRVLQERMIERVGDLKPRPVDIRVVAATNKEPGELIKAGQFREDLFYRLNELTLQLPALRERGDDIEVLSQYFMTKYRAQYSATSTGFTNQALKAMRGYYWPGNVRELEARVKKALIMSDRALLNSDDLGLEDSDKRHIQPLADEVENFKVQYVKAVLDLNNWNKAQTARDLGIDARTVFRYVEKLQDAE